MARKVRDGWVSGVFSASFLFPGGKKAVLNLNHCLSERTQRFFSFFPFHSL